MNCHSYSNCRRNCPVAFALSYSILPKTEKNKFSSQLNSYIATPRHAWRTRKYFLLNRNRFRSGSLRSGSPFGWTRICPSVCYFIWTKEHCAAVLRLFPCTREACRSMITSDSSPLLILFRLSSTEGRGMDAEDVAFSYNENPSRANRMGVQVIQLLEITKAGKDNRTTDVRSSLRRWILLNRVQLVTLSRFFCVFEIYMVILRLKKRRTTLSCSFGSTRQAQLR